MPTIMNVLDCATAASWFLLLAYLNWLPLVCFLEGFPVRQFWVVADHFFLKMREKHLKNWKPVVGGVLTSLLLL